MIKLIAKFPVQLNGHIYYKGEACSYEGEITPRVAANFTDAEGNALKAAEADKGSPEGKTEPDGKAAKDEAETASIARTVEVMGRDGVKRALDAMNITYAPTTGTQYLAKTLLIARGEIDG